MRRALPSRLRAFAPSRLRAFAPRAAEGLSFGGLLLWQGAGYFSWAALLPVVAWAGRRWRPARDAWYAPLPGFVLGSAPIVAAHCALVAALRA